MGACRGGEMERGGGSRGGGPGHGRHLGQAPNEVTPLGDVRARLQLRLQLHRHRPRPLRRDQRDVQVPAV